MDAAPFDILQRMENAVEKVRQRLARAAGALQAHSVPYALVGGNAIAAWVATIDEAAVRNTQDVDILIRRADLPAAAAALETACFVHRHAANLDLFLDGPKGNPRQAVHVIFAGEFVKESESTWNPSVEDSQDVSAFRILNLESLIRITLTAFRAEDRVHLRDLVDVGLVDHTWLPRFQPELAARLQTLLDNPEG